ncbi:Phytosulfokines 5 [Hordeum vulgare]|nr:Phytosulfokines 5 [Hordeum vulgare]
MAAAKARIEEEAICAHILKKQQRRNTCALAQDQNRAVREMDGLPPKVEKEVNDGEDNSCDKLVQLDLYCVFDWYFREKDDKGFGKGKDNCG